MESKKNIPPGRRKNDARVRRTRDALGNALIDLIQEKDFNEITVQDVLDKAGVSRATFYAHYSDKQDLLTGEMEKILVWMCGLLQRDKEPLSRLAPVTELFTHVAQARQLHVALCEAGQFEQFRSFAEHHFARSIGERLNVAVPTLSSSENRAFSYALGGALMSLLDVWLNTGASESPAEMDARFHRLAFRGLGPQRTAQAKGRS